MVQFKAQGGTQTSVKEKRNKKHEDSVPLITFIVQISIVVQIGGFFISVSSFEIAESLEVELVHR